MEEEKAEDKKIKKSGVPLCCVGCVRWEKFGKNCFYYWEGKKHCTMWAGSWEEVPL
ncbi:hypothetical protein HYX03_00430 [Candidatus Woesearchaeota archaeon]|nr:hypothetical protein [Candidatus Woesearchaeota archaeon]